MIRFLIARDETTSSIQATVDARALSPHPPPPPPPPPARAVAVTILYPPLALRTGWILLLAALLFCLPVAQAVAQSVAYVPSNWPLKPSNLDSGDKFRLIFLTSGKRNATQSSASTYHTYVQQAASAGHTAIRPYSQRFRALVSTHRTDARDTTQTYAGSNTDSPIFWLNGAKVADNLADFYDGSWDSSVIRNEVGQEDIGHITVFTGSDADGTRSFNGGKYFTVGPYIPSGLDGGWAATGYIVNGGLPELETFDVFLTKPIFKSGEAKPRSESHHFYAVSFPFEVSPLTVTIGATDTVLEGVTEGESIEFSLITNSANGWSHGHDVRVRVTGNPASLIDPDDRVRTFRALESSTSQAFTVDTLVDTGSADGTVTIEIVAVDDHKIGSASSITIPINNDALFSNRVLQVEESGFTFEGSPLHFTLSVPGYTNGERNPPEMTISIAPAGGGDCKSTASADDFTQFQSSRITMSDTTYRHTVTTINDNFHEKDEVVCLKIHEPEYLRLPGGKKEIYVSGVIRDNDPPPTVSVSSPRAGESSNDLTFEVTLDKPPHLKDVTVAYSDSGRGTATSGGDYVAVPAGTLTFSRLPINEDGTRDTRKTITVSLDDDSVTEEDETVVLRFNKVKEGRLDGGGRNLYATGTIVDDEPRLHELRLRQPEGGATVFEGNPFNLYADLWIDGEAIGALDKDVTFTWDALAHSRYLAIPNVDFTGVSKASATIPAGQTSVALTVTTLADQIDESVEYFNVVLSAVAQGLEDEVEIPSRFRTVTIALHDSPFLSILDADKRTEGQTLEFPVTLSVAAPGAVRVPWKTETRAGQTATAGKDYTAASGTLTIPAGKTRGIIRVRTLQDSIDEPDQDFSVVLTAPFPSGVDRDLLPGGERATGVIRDDDARPGITVADVSTTEGGGLTFNVALARASEKPVRLGWATRSPSQAGATFGLDYRGKQSGEFTIAPGDTAAAIEFTTIDDDLDEPDETFRFRLFGYEAVVDAAFAADALRAQQTVQTQNTVPILDATATIVDNDGTTLAITDAQPVNEAGGGTAVFRVILSHAQTTPVTVTVESADGNNPPVSRLGRTTNAVASSGLRRGDYESVPARTLTFQPGETVKTVSVTINADDEFLPPANSIEETENFRMLLSNPTGATISRGTAIGTILDSIGNRYSIANRVKLVREGESIRVRVRRDRADEATRNIRVCLEKTGTGKGHATLAGPGATGADVYLRSRVANSTGCVARTDEDAITTTWIRFAPGQYETSFRVNTIRDQLNEGDETFRVTHGSPELINTSTDSYLFPEVFTIVDADFGLLRIESKNSPYEGQRAEFEIYVDDPAMIPTTGRDIYFLTSSGTAVAGEDYVEQKRALVSLTRPTSADQPAATFVVDTIDDDDFEGDETFSVTLSGLPYNLRLHPTLPTVTIRDEDGNRIYLDDAVVDEGERVAVAVHLEFPVERGIEVAWKTVAGSAESPGDFTAVTAGTLTIAAGATTATIHVETKEDTTKEKDESFRVVITDVDYAEALIGPPALVAIRDDDTGFSISGLPDDTVEENKSWDSGVPSFDGVPSGDVLWTVEGDDAALFTIDSDTGQITLAAQNFEQPADKDNDNVYNVTVRVSDEDDNTGSHAVAVTVTDATYGVVVFDPLGNRVNEGSALNTKLVYVYTVPPPPPAVSVQWRLQFPSGVGNAASAQDVTLLDSGGPVELQPVTVREWRGSNSITNGITTSQLIQATADQIHEQEEVFNVEFFTDSDDVLLGQLGEVEQSDSFEVRIIDGNPPGLTLSTTALTINEADDPSTPDDKEHETSYTVKLNIQPAQDVTISLSTGKDAAVTVDTDADTADAQTTLTFTEDDWNDAQTVIVTALDDDISNTGDKRAATITHTAGASYGSVTAELEVTVTDDDMPEVTIAPKSASAVTEGTAAVFTLTANPVPAANLTVNLTVADAANADFVSAENQGAGKTVVIPTTGSVDYSVATEGGATETTDEPDGDVTVTVTSGSGYTVSSSDDGASVTVEDDDATVVTLTTPDTTAMEEDSNATASLALTLGRALRADEVLAVPLQFAGGVVGTDFTLALSGTPTGVALAATMGVVTFTGSAGGSATVATVALAALSDADAVDDTVTVSIPSSDTRSDPADQTEPVLTATGLSGGASGTGNGQITVEDDDKAGVTVTETGAATVVTEASGDGNTDSYTVVLDTEPTHEVRVTVTAPAGLLIDGSDATDTAPAGLPIDGSDATDTAPAGLPIDGSDATDTKTLTETLIFTTSDWDEEQTVNVYGVDDNVDQGTGRSLTIKHTVSLSVSVTDILTDGDYDEIKIADVPVTLVDDDTAGVTVTETGAATVVTEASGSGNTDTYTVVLNTEPTHEVRVKVMAPDGLWIDGPDESEAKTSSETLTFTTGNWDEAQTVTVYGADDDLDQGRGRSLTIEHTVASTDDGYDEIAIDNVSVTVTDDDVPAVTVTGGDAVTEGADAVFTVTANPVPAANLVVNLEVADAANSDFVLAGHEGDKTVTIPVTGSVDYTVNTVNDSGANADEPDGEVTVTVAASDGDPATYTLGATSSAGVAVSDDDATGVTLRVTDASATEGDDTKSAALTLTLGRALRGEEVLAVPLQFAGGILGTDFSLSLSGTAAGVGLAANTGVVTFTGSARGSATEATVALAALSDADAVDDTVTVSIPATSTGNGVILAATNLSGGASGTGNGQITVEDDDTAAFTLDPTSLTVTEGGTNTYTVKLSSQPTAPVTVTVASRNPDVTVDGPDAGSTGSASETLTFTTGNWSTARTVTVIAGQDTDVANDTATLTHTAAGGGYATVMAELAVTVTDNDVPAVTITGGDAVTEGADAVFTVTANPVPAANLVVNLEVADAANSDFVLAGHEGDKTVTIPVTGSVDYTVNTVNDSGANADEPDGEVTVTVAASDGDPATYTLGATSSAGVAVSDDDATGVTLRVTDASATEGDDTKSAALTLTLGRALRGEEVLAVPLQFAGGILGTDFSLSLSGTAAGVGLAANTGVVTFTGSARGSATEATVALAALSDADAVDDTVTVSIPATSTGNGVILAATNLSGGASGTGNGQITVEDDDTAAFTLDPTSLTVTEGGTNTYTVKLSSQPTAPVTVTVASRNPDVTVDGPDAGSTGSASETLTFTTGNWSTARTVTVIAGQDTDVANDTATLTHTAAGGGYATVMAELAVTVTDNDVPAVTITGGDAVTEGADAVFTVTANPVPAANLVVNLEVADAANSDFVLAGHEGDKTVTIPVTGSVDYTVNTVNDSGANADEPDGEVTVTVAASDGDPATYTLGATSSAGVAVSDDDATGVTLRVTDASATEGDDTKSAALTLTLGRALRGEEVLAVPLQFAGGILGTDFSLSLSGTAAGVGLAANTGVVTFTGSARGSATEATVALAALSDADAVDDTVTVSIPATSTGNGVILAATNLSGGASGTGNGQITVEDDDTAAFTLDPTSLTVTEGGTNTYTVKLSSQPTAPVTVTVASRNPDVTVDGPDAGSTGSASETLTFTTGNWSTARTVTVIAGQDTDVANDTATLTHTAAGGGYATVMAELAVTVTDNDVPAVTITGGDAVTEGADAVFTVTANPVPAANLVVNLEVADAANSDFVLAGHEGDKTVTIPVTGSVDYTVNTVNDSGANADEPDGEVTVTVAASDGDPATYTLGATSSAGVAVSDDDATGVTLRVTDASATEGDDTKSAALTLTLGRALRGEEVLAVPLQFAGGILGTDFSLSLSGTAAGVGLAANTGVVTFTGSARGSATEATVALAALSDADAVDDTVTVSIPATSTGNGVILAATNLSGGASGTGNGQITVEDDDTAAFTLDPTSLTVTEGGTNTYTVKLSSQPTAPVTVTVASRNPDVTVDGPDAGSTGSASETLTFTTGNWSTARTVTVIAGQDTDVANDTATLTHTAAGGGYATVMAELAVTVTDNDVPAVTITGGDAVTEGADAVFTVTANPVPAANLVVNLEVADAANSDFVLAGHEGDKTVTIPVTGSVDYTVNTVNDSGANADEPDGEVTVTVAASDGDPATYTLGATSSAGVAVSDDDATGVTLRVTDASATEGDDTKSAALTLTLGRALRGEEVLAVPLQFAGGILGTDFSLSLSGTAAGVGLAANTGVVTFTGSARGSATEATVALAALSDADAVDDTVTVSIPATSTGNGVILAATNLSGGASGTGNGQITVEDDDTAAFTLDPTSLTVTEGGTNTYTVKLSSQPTAPVTVTVASRNPDVTVDGPDAGSTGSASETLTFTTGNWSTARTVTVIAGQDTDVANDTATLTHTAAGGGYATVMAELAVTVTDNDVPAVTITGGDAVTEGADAVFTVTANPVPAANLVVNLEVADAANSDFVLAGHEGDKTVTIPVTGSVDYTVNTVNDSGANADEPDGEVTVTVAASDGDPATYTLGATSSAGVAVSDDDATGVTLRVTDASATEGDDTKSAALTLTLGRALRGEEVLAVPLQFAGGILGTDFSLSLSGTAAGVGLAANTGVVTFTGSARGSATEATVALAALSDADAVDDTVTVSIPATSTGNGVILAATNLSGGASGTGNGQITVEDDDTAAFTLDPTSLTVTEGGTNTYTVKLSSQPTAPVTVTVASRNPDVTVDGPDAGSTGSASETLTFTTGNWSTARTVTVIAGQDTDVANDTATLTHTAAGGGYATVMAELAVTVTDNDVPAVTITGGDAVTEGADAVFTVTANPVPAANLVVNLEVADAANSDFVLAGHEGDKTVTIPVTGSVDYTVNTVNDSGANADEPDGEVTVTVAASDGDPATYTLGATSSAGVAVSDDDATGVTLRVTDASATEGDDTKSAALTLTLGRALRGEEVLAVPLQFAGGILGTDFSLSLSGTAAGVGLAANTGVVTFTGSARGSATEATVALAALSDADAVDDTVTVSIPATSTGNGVILAATNLSGGASGTGNGQITVEDDDTAAFTLDPTSLTVTEGGTNTYTVKLSSQPTAPVTVTVASRNPDVTVDGPDAGSTGSASETLTFTTGNWSTARTVTVIAGQDTDVANDTATLTHTAAGGGYATVMAELAVTVTDNDVPAVTITGGDAVTEGADAVFTVTANPVPAANLVVNLEVADAANSDFVLAGHEGDKTVTIPVTGSVDYTVNTVNDSGANADEPDGEVTVTVAASDGDPATYTLGATSSAGVAVSDDDATGVTLRVTDASATEGDDTKSAALTLTLGRALRGEEVLAVPLQFAGGILGTDFSLSLSGTAAGVGLAANTGVVTFTGSARGSATEATVALAALSDADAVDDTVTVSIPATSTGNGVILAATNLSGGASGTGNGQITVEDDDTAAFTLDPTSLTVTEGGTNTYTVKLSSQPTAPVTVTVASRNPDVTVDGPDAGSTGSASETLTFTTGNWSTARTVTVIAGQDTDVANDTATLTHTAAGGGYATVMAELAVTVTDNDVPAVTITGGDAVTEGADAVFTVTANPVPAANLVVNLEVADAANSDFVLAGHEGDKTVTIPVTGSVDYTVNTVNDSGANADEPDGEVTVTVAASDGDPATYTLGATSSAGVAVSDDDATGVTLRVTDASATEGDDTKSAALTLTLGRALRGEEVLAVPLQFAGGILGTDFSLSLSGTAAGVGLAANTGVVTFTGSARGSATEATVALAALSDADAVDDTVTVSIPATSTGNGVILAATNLSGGASGTGNGQITVEDDDTAAFTLDPTSLTVTEGGTNTYTVKLSSQPTAPVTVTVASRNPDVTVDGPDAGSTGSASETLTFTTGNWSTARTVTVIAGQDTDVANDTATLTHTAAGGGYATVTAELPVTVTDDDRTRLVLTPTALTVAEGGTETYTVALSSQPTAPVTVTVASRNPDVTVDGPDAGSTGSASETLTFTTGNWSTARTVTVIAGQDTDVANDTATLTHTAAGGGYATVTAELPVTVTDDDRTRLVLTPTALTVAEGGTETYTVALSSQPTAEVAVTITGVGDVAVDTDPDTDGDQTTLTFSPTTAANLWSVPQTVTVTAGQDEDVVDEEVTLTHTAAGGGYATVTAELPVTVTDDDRTRLVLTPTALTVAEGGTETYTVALSSQPTMEVTVTVVSPVEDVTVDTDPDTDGDQTTLTFSPTTAANLWSVPQTVTVTAGQDEDVVDEEVTLTHTAAGGDYATVTAELPVTVTDDDRTRLVLTPTALTVAEGGTETYTVALSSQPTAEVAVTITGVGDVAVDTDPDTDGDQTTLTFSPTTAANLWSVPQTVTVTAGQDEDVVDEEVTLTHTAAGGDYATVTAELPVTVTDDDRTRLVLTPTALTVAEGGTETYTVALSSQPTMEVTVTVVSPVEDVTVDTDPDTDGDQTVLTVNPNTWSTARMVTVTATMGPDEEVLNNVIMLEHSATGGDYDSIEDELPVIVTEDDTTILLTLPMVSFTDSGSEVDEGVGRHGIAMSLDRPAGSDLTVRYTVGGSASMGPDGDLLIEGLDAESGTLVIERGVSEVDIPMMILDDPDHEGDETVVLTLESGTGYEMGRIVTHTLTILDNDDPPLVTISTENSSSVEEGQDVVFRVTVEPVPPTALSVNVLLSESSGSDYLDAGSEGMRVVRVPGRGSGADAGSAVIRVSTEDDDVDEADGLVTAAVVEGAGYQVGVPGSAEVQVLDNDDPPLVTISTENSSSVEEGQDVVFRVTVEPVPPTELPVNVLLSESSDSDYLDADSEGMRVVRVPGRGSGADAGSAVIRISTEDDELDEPAGVVTAAVVEGAGYRIGVPGSAEVQVLDNDAGLAEGVQSWLTRFGRTVTGIVLEGVRGRLDRMSELREPGLSGTLAGAPFGRPAEDVTAKDASVEDTEGTITTTSVSPEEERAEEKTEAATPLLSESVQEEWSREWKNRQSGVQRGFALDGSEESGLTGYDLMMGSAFEITKEGAGGRMQSAWGSGSTSSFDGNTDGVSVNGEVSALMLGQDWTGSMAGDPERTYLLGGLIAQSLGEGGYSGGGRSGELEANLTSIVPYGALKLSEELQVWGSLGLGSGKMELKLSDEEATTGADIKETDIDWRMVAVGFRNQLPGSGRESDFAQRLSDHGISLELHGDISGAWMQSDEVEGLPSASGDTQRLRIGVEGSRVWQQADGGTLTPKLGLALRHDAGDAETGLGLELGTGLMWTGQSGLEANMEGRALMMHEDGNFRDWGVSASVSYSPPSDSGRGFSGSLSMDFGGDASRGDFLGREVFPELVEADAGGRWVMEGGYGLHSYERGLVGSPYVKLSGQDRLEEMRFGYRVEPKGADRGLQMELDVFTRLEKATVGDEDKVSAGLELRLSW